MYEPTGTFLNTKYRIVYVFRRNVCLETGFEIALNMN